MDPFELLHVVCITFFVNDKFEEESIKTVSFLIQLFASVIVKKYRPEVKFDKLEVVLPLLHKKVNGESPLVAATLILPLFNPQAVLLLFTILLTPLLAGTIMDCVIMQLFASETVKL